MGRSVILCMLRVAHNCWLSLSETCGDWYTLNPPCALVASPPGVLHAFAED